jgi:hypothetical protein
MANFRMEGQGIMTGIYSAHWTVEPLTPPRPWRHCSTCGESRRFLSSGRIRLNANGRRLDAWLIYKCESCERTWNHPIAERVAVASLAEADLQAMQQSDPAWVREREFDLAALKRHCDRVELSSAVTVTKTVTKFVAEGAAGPWSAIVLTIDAPRPSGQRLDRLLASELKLSRSALQAMQRADGLQIGSASRGDLKRPVSGSLVLRFVAARLTDSQRASLPALLSG